MFLENTMQCRNMFCVYYGCLSWRVERSLKLSIGGQGFQFVGNSMQHKGEGKVDLMCVLLTD